MMSNVELRVENVEQFQQLNECVSRRCPGTVISPRPEIAYLREQLGIDS
jgi:hypothetical protein